MRVYLSTSITPRFKVYDSTAPTKPPGPIASFLAPVVTLTDDNDNPYWTYGTPSTVPWGLFLALGLIALVGARIIR